MWVFDEGVGLNCRDVTFVPGLYKIFDEILGKGDPSVESMIDKLLIGAECLRTGTKCKNLSSVLLPPCTFDQIMFIASFDGLCSQNTWFVDCAWEYWILMTFH